jgi:hypothetical protein
MKQKPAKEPVVDCKRCWHLYSLQSLSTDKFIQVVEKILKGEYELLNSITEIYKK